MEKSKSMNTTDKHVIASRIFSVLGFAIQIINTVLYACGVSSFYGRDTNIINMVNAALGVFNMGKAYYRGIFGCVIAILYFVLLILMLKNIIASIGLLKRQFKRSDDVTGNHVKSMLTIMEDYVMSSFIKILIFMVCVGFIRPYTMTSNAKITIMLSILMFFVTRTAYCVFNRYTLKSTLINIAYLAIFIIPILVILICSQTNAVEEIINSFSYLISGGEFFSFILIIVNALAHMILALFTLGAVSAVCFLVPINFSELRDNVKRVLYALGAHIIVLFANYAINGNVITLSSVTVIINNILPLIFAAVSLFLFTFSKNEKDIIPVPSSEDSLSKEVESDNIEADKKESNTDSQHQE